MARGIASTTRPGNRLSKGMSGGGTRPAAVGLAKLLFLAASQISAVAAAPLRQYFGIAGHGGGEEPAKDPDDASLWIYLTVAMVLVLSGGAFAGLTIALMGQDGIYLQVIAASGEGAEQKHAKRVHKLLSRGKHWVLVTLLLANVIVNETLPIVLDRSLGGGWPAVLGSTALIVIFGEVIPQSICVRYGLQIGAFMSPCVLVLMYLLAPIAWPTAKLLDHLLGEDHGTVYKKSGLKTLVTLHKTLGPSPSDRLNQDEVTIISAVLDLKDKPVGDIMTPMGDVFTMSADTILDEITMDTILSAGYSRIPIYEPGNENNFIGMLLVKILITYDPEDCKRVGEFALATLPETRPETSCLDIVNFFQEGKSHMVLVSEFPGEDHGATGVVTLEDVIEELIGECVSPTPSSLVDYKQAPILIPQRREIIDESDVYIDVHKAIRRLAPAPTYKRAPKGQIIEPNDSEALKPNQTLIDFSEDGISKSGEGNDNSRNRKTSLDETRRHSHSNLLSGSPKANFVLRRGSSTAAEAGSNIVRGNANDMREHLKHLGPSNLASRPKQTRYATVKIKPGHLPGLESATGTRVRNSSISEEPYTDVQATPRRLSSVQGGEGEGLLSNAARDASDGVLAIHQGYGSLDRKSTSENPPKPDLKNKGQQVNFDGASEALRNKDSFKENPFLDLKGKKDDSGEGSDAVGSLKSGQTSPGFKAKRRPARSGSITENIVDSNGVRKVVLQTTSSSDEEREAAGKKPEEEGEDDGDEGEEVRERGGAGGEWSTRGDSGKKKKRNKKKKPSRKGTANSSAGPSG